MHVVLGFIAIIVGSVHLTYCCRYYYLGVGYWGAIFFVSAGLYHTRTNFPYKVVLLVLNGLALVAGLTLITLSAFGVLCWALDGHLTADFFVASPPAFANRTRAIFTCIEEKDDRFALAKLANGDLYQKCFDGMRILGYWTNDTRAAYYSPAYAWTELKYTQVIASGSLTVIGLVEVIISMVILCRTWYDDANTY